MIVQQEFLNKLKDFGLNSYESKLWTALLSRGVSTAGELSDIANVPRSRTYDVLESLEKKGFIIMKLGKPIKYIAVPPKEVIERVKKKVVEDARKQTKIIDELQSSEILTELISLHTKGVELVEPTELSGAIKGRGNLYNHVETMLKSAQSSVHIMTTAEGLNRKTELIPTLKKLKLSGVKIKIAAPLDEQTKESEKLFENVAELKNIPNISARFFLIDETQLMFMLMDDKTVHPSYDSGIWVNTPFFTTALKQLFEREWETQTILN